MDERLAARTIDTTDGRTCGSCTLCCKLLAVGAPGEDFAKPQGVWCEHVCADKRGCSIYATRPKSCAHFDCVWLRGCFQEEDRPDRSRVVVSLEQSIGDKITDRDGNTVLHDMPVWCVYEREPGAASGKRGRAIVEQLAGMQVRHKEGGPLVGPFPVAIIPSARHLRRMRLPGADHFVPCYRPGEDPE